MKGEDSTASSLKKAEGVRITLPPAQNPSASGSSPPVSLWSGRADAIPIPSSVPKSEFLASSHGWGSAQDSSRRMFTAPSSWRTNFTPSSWGGVSIHLNDDASASGDDQSDRGTVDSSTSLSYAKKRTLLRQMSKSSILSTATHRRPFAAVRERWTKRLEDFREYEAGIFKSLLPLKAAVAAALAACLCFAPFIPESWTYYGLVAVLGVGTALEPNVGLTLEKGYNLMLGSGLAGACALAVSVVEPYTGKFRPYYMVFCVFLGGFVPRLVFLPAVIKTRWGQTMILYILVFHGSILNESVKMVHAYEFFLNCLFYSAGFFITFVLVLFVKPYYAGDSLLALLVSDFHTAGVVLERIVEDYKSGIVLTKIQVLLSGEVTEDHIHHDLQYIMKSSEEVEKLMGAVVWEPPHGFFFHGYPWDLYPTLFSTLLHMVYDLISLDSALRAEIQAPLYVRQIFSEEMEIVARECSMLFHKVGDSLLEHKKNDYEGNVQRARLAAIALRTKLSSYSAMVIAQDRFQPHPSKQLTRTTSLNSVEEVLDESSELRDLSPPRTPNLPSSLPLTPIHSPSPPITPVRSPSPPMTPISPHPPPRTLVHPPVPSRIPIYHRSPWEAEREEQNFSASHNFSTNEGDWQAQLFSRRKSISDNWEETQNQISSLSLIKFATILIEFMGKVNSVMILIEDISVQARFSEPFSDPVS